MPFLSYYYNCIYRAQGTSSTVGFSNSCVNWWCYKDTSSGLGSISTQLYGHGRGKLDYGICWGPSASNKVTVYLDNIEVSSIAAGEANKVIEFDYTNGQTLKIEESSNTVFQFNSFSVISCN